MSAPAEYKVISLERRMRIAARANPVFTWLSGFVGAGLLFAGITDWCGTGRLIAKMP